MRLWHRILHRASLTIAVCALLRSASPNRMKRRKVKAERKEDSVRIRLTAEQKETLTKAAAKAGLDVSGWIRSIALREATRSG